MKSTLLSDLIKAGNDLSEYLKRFEQDEDTCELLCSMFVNETDYAEYITSYEQDDLTGCMEHIRALKGSSYNVGLTMLYDKTLEIIHCINIGDRNRLATATSELKDIYEATVNILTKE